MSRLAAFLTKQPVDWTRVLARSTPEVRQNILEWRNRRDEAQRLLVEAQQSHPRIDFSHYESVLRESQEDVQLVQQLKKQYESFKPAEQTQLGSELLKIDAEEEQAVAKVESFLKQLEVDISNAKVQYEKYSKMPPVEQWTLNDYYSIFPEVKKQFEERITHDKWYPPTGDFEEDMGRKDKDAHHH